MDSKPCSKCGVEKNLSEYYRHSGGYLHTECKKCHYKRTLEWRRANKDKCAHYSREHVRQRKEKMTKEEYRLYCKNHLLKGKFGITLDDYNAILQQQHGVCAICGQAETATLRGKLRMLAVDHDHKTGGIRGLLCVDCNQGIGRFKDSTLNLVSAIEYLRIPA